MQTDGEFDVVVVGCGVVGAAVARALALRGVPRIAVIEQREAPFAGASKGNSAMVHSAFDADPGSLEATLVRRGHELFEAFAARHLQLPFKRMGAMMVAFTDDEKAVMETEVKSRAEANGVETTLLSRDEVLSRMPRLSSTVRCGLFVPGEWCTDPCRFPALVLHEALATGRVTLLLGAAVNGISTRSVSPGSGVMQQWEISTVTAGAAAPERARQRLAARFVVNAAGLFADAVEALAGRPARFAMFPRLGRFIGFDAGATSLPHMVLPIPTPKTKGVIVFETVHGELVVGPTAEDPNEPRPPQRDVAARLHALGAAKVPDLGLAKVTWDFSGSRPAIAGAKDYVFFVESNWATLAGVRSTGLTSSLAIGEWLAERIDQTFFTAPVIDPSSVAAAAAAGAEAFVARIAPFYKHPIATPGNRSKL